MIAAFFINRPIFAAVLSIAITLIGGIALASLPMVAASGPEPREPAST